MRIWLRDRPLERHLKSFGGSLRIIDQPVEGDMLKHLSILSVTNIFYDEVLLGL